MEHTTYAMKRAGWGRFEGVWHGLGVVMLSHPLFIGQKENMSLHVQVWGLRYFQSW